MNVIRNGESQQKVTNVAKVNKVNKKLANVWLDMQKSTKGYTKN